MSVCYTFTVVSDSLLFDTIMNEHPSTPGQINFEVTG